MSLVAFPGIGINFDINPTAFSIGNLHIRWYGIIMALGFLLAAWYCYKHSDRYGVKSDNLIDLLIFAVPLSIIGARAYYVLFMYNEYYYGNPQLIWQIWDGGVAIYGAIIMGVITAVVFCKVKRIRIGNMLDVGAMGLLIGQIIGRWGNFVNEEAYGTETTLPWAMKLSNGTMVHPCFLYESLWNLAGFIILHFYTKKRRYPGEIFLIYTAWYGFGRGLIEGLRTDSLYFFDTGLRVSQALGFASCVIALGILIYLYLFRVAEPEKLTNAYLPPRAKKKTVSEEEDEKTEEEFAEGEEPEDMESDEAFYGEGDEPADGSGGAADKSKESGGEAEKQDDKSGESPDESDIKKGE